MEGWPGGYPAGDRVRDAVDAVVLGGYRDRADDVGGDIGRAPGELSECLHSTMAGHSGVRVRLLGGGEEQGEGGGGKPLGGGVPGGELWQCGSSSDWVCAVQNLTQRAEVVGEGPKALDGAIGFRRRRTQDNS
ncbi:hypothetical protein [Streptomyces sp. NBC_01244]|uniref:hypothetical protein n=1 Tax=Streptomyces sp. NBC_01244 TaxID=2903797 RepID=UPI002E113FA5|nr:hypothetical protein OG247_04840 [Streptomyces sp. NBC_01244]